MPLLNSYLILSLSNSSYLLIASLSEGPLILFISDCSPLFEDDAPPPFSSLVFAYSNSSSRPSI